MSLLEYAAQWTIQSTMRVHQTKEAVQQIPGAIIEVVAQVKAEAQRLVTEMQEQIFRIRQQREQAAAARAAKAAALAEANAAARRKRQRRASRAAAAKKASAAAAAAAAAAANDEEANTSPQSGTEAKDKDKIDALTAQILALKEQMEMFTKMAAVGAPTAAAVAPGEAAQTNVAAAPAVQAAVSPPCPPQAAQQQREDPKQTETPPPSARAATKTAPPPPAPPMAPVAPVPIAPPCRAPLAPRKAAAASGVSSPRSARVSMLSDITNGTHNLKKSRDRVSKGSSSSKPGKSTTGGNVVENKSGVKCFTRRLPGSAGLTHSELIKVSAKIKLRKTDVPRSPGGTPATKQKHTGGDGILAAALFRKFRHARQSLSPVKRSRTGGAGAGVDEWDDKENVDWDT